MRILRGYPEMDVAAVAEAIDGLPEATGYDVVVRPLRYRKAPHLSALTEFEERRITIRIPEPFFAFGEVVVWGARRVNGRAIRFIPLSEGVTFHTRIEVARFLYCHEWYHWYLWEIRGTASAAEIACDRFALRNFRKPVVTMADAEAALRRPRGSRAGPAPSQATHVEPWVPGAVAHAAGRLF